MRPGGTYRFKLIDDAPGALEYDDSITWSSRAVNYELYDGDDLFENGSVQYDNNYIVSITFGDFGSDVTKLKVWFDSTGTRETSSPEPIPVGFTSSALEYNFK